MQTLARCLIFWLVLGVGGGAYAAGGAAAPLPSAPIDRGDKAALQRGAVAFMNYCSGCHSAGYMRYGRLAEDLGIPEHLLRARLMPSDASVADGIASAMPTERAVEWFNQAPPDLSLSAKLRGNDWLYAYLRAFYRDDSTDSGWNNEVFANVAMPHVLAHLQGEYRLTPEGEKILHKKGRLTAAQYDRLALDMVAFMDYMAEPSREARYRAGYVILSLLFVLLMFAYFLYREYWRDVS